MSNFLIVPLLHSVIEMTVRIWWCVVVRGGGGEVIFLYKPKRFRR
jgi:hypothetical protein